MFSEAVVRCLVFFSFSFAVLMGVISALLSSLAFLNQIIALIEQAGTWQKMDGLLFCYDNT